MQFFITGAAGFVGRRLISILLEDKQSAVIAVDRELLPVQNKRLEFIKSDLGAVSKIETDILIHLVGSPGVWFSEKNPDLDYKINVESVDKAFRAVKDGSIKKAIFSSSWQADGTKGFPENTYGRHKLEAEERFIDNCKRLGINYVILRMSWIYGPGMKKNPIYDIYEGKMYFDMESVLDFIFVDDVCRAFIMASKDDGWNGKVINISSGQGVLVKDIYKELKALGLKQEVQTLSSDKRHVVKDNSEAVKLGWRPQINIKDGLRITYESFSR